MVFLIKIWFLLDSQEKWNAVWTAIEDCLLWGEKGLHCNPYWFCFSFFFLIITGTVCFISTCMLIKLVSAFFFFF